MDFWPKRWGGRNFDGDKGLGTVQTLGLPFSKQVNGNTTARKIGEFSETVIEEEEPGFYATGWRKQGGVNLFETWGNIQYQGNFSKIKGTLLSPLGGNEYTVLTATYKRIDPSFYDDVPGTPYAPVAVVYDLEIGFNRGRLLQAASLAKATVEAASVEYEVFRKDVADDHPINALPYFAQTPTGHGGGQRSGYAFFTHQWGPSTDAWGEKVPDVTLARGSRDGVTNGIVGRLPGTEGKPLLIANAFTVEPGKFCMLASLLFSPHPYNSGYQGGDLMLYKTVDGGATFSVATLPAVKANLPAAPALQSPAATPEGYLRHPADYDCRLNIALRNIALTSNVLVMTPTAWLMAHVQYRQISGVWRNDGELYRTNDAGASFSKVTLPALLEEWSPVRATKIETMVYLGQGRVLAKTRSEAFGTDNKWNLIRSDNFGASWVCLPKVGLPTTAAPTSFFTGHFKVMRKRTTILTSIVLLPVWDGEGYALYESKTDGTDWRRVGRIAPSEEAFRMERDLVDGVPDLNFGNLLYLGTEDEPAPLSMETPWRYDRSKTYEEET